jgi:hypothetical protein
MSTSKRGDKNKMSSDAIEKSINNIKPPTPLSHRFVRAIVGFGVGVVVGCAPILGATNIPLFSSLLSLFPASLRTTLLPLGGFLVGLIAAGTQFYSGAPISMARIRLWAKRSLISGVALLPLFLICYLLLVRQVHYREDFTVSFVTGLTRSDTCSCSPKLTDSMCLRTLSANPDDIELCWGRTQVKLSEFVLGITYLFFIGSFSSFIGLLLLQENKTRSPASTPRSPHE